MNVHCLCFPFLQIELQSDDWVVDWRVKRDEIFMAASKIEYHSTPEDNAVNNNEDDHSTLGGIISTNENRRKDNNYKFPQVIWQTAKSHNPPPAVANIMSTWKDKNPGWDQRLLDDAEVDAFMVQHFNESVVAAFRKLPVPVMRADFFRLAVVYHLGGIYADVDVECSVPIHDWWFDGAVQKCEVVVGMENDIHVSNWGFASVKHHLLFQQAIDVSLSRFVEHGVNTSWEHFVHATTGPGVSTTALADLARAAGCKWNELPGAIREIYESCRVTLKEEYNICFVNEITQRKWFHNHYASQKVRETHVKCYTSFYNHILIILLESIAFADHTFVYFPLPQIELQGEDFVGDWTKTQKEVFKEASLNQSP
jgi:mannosyltransferase OCH1-like enzyme